MSKIARPKEALIAITYRCNARCSMCNTWKYPSDPRQEIQPSELVSLPQLDFCNITGGEPFIRKDIADFIAVVSAKAKRVVISTNGYFTDEIVALAEKFPRIGFRISIEGLSAVNDQLRGLKDGFDHGMRTLLALYRMKRKDIGFGITLSDENIMDMLALYELGKAMNLEFATACTHNTFYFHKFDNRISRLEDLSSQMKKLIIDLLGSRRIKNWFRAYFNYGLLNYAYGGKRLLPCAAGKDLVFIDSFGNLMPCNAMEAILGNLKNTPFNQIWESKAACGIRDGIKNCDKHCWMIGSVAPAIKSMPAGPSLWVLRNKFRLLLGKDIDLSFTKHKEESAKLKTQNAKLQLKA